MKCSIIVKNCIAICLLCILLTGCVGPLYMNGEYKCKEVTPPVYLISSSYYGTFICPQSKGEAKAESAYIDTIAFSAWQDFDYDVNMIFRNIFRQHNIGVIFLEEQQIQEGLLGFIAGDSLKDYHLQHLELHDIYDNVGDTGRPTMDTGLFIVFTKLQLTRAFVFIYARAKYYVYSISDGSLVFVNESKKKYMMKSAAERTLKKMDEDDYIDQLERRLIGLHYDEKDSYERISGEFILNIIMEILSNCIAKQ